MSALYLYDDDLARSFQPFALTRPLGEVRAGALLIRHRWERATGSRAAGFISAPHLDRFSEGDAPRAATGVVPAGSVVVDSRCVVSLGASLGDVDVWTCSGRVAAVRLGRDLSLEGLLGQGPPLETFEAGGSRVGDLEGRWLHAPWDLVGMLVDQLRDDITVLGPTLDVVPPSDSVVMGDHQVYVERGATVEPQVVFDVTAGPVLIRAGATVRAFTRVGGPCYVGEGSTLLGDRVQWCSIGESCLVRGEIAESIIIGHANKSHDGFVGHSVLGRWANLGAGTITSNLKNTYGVVSMWTPDGVRPTGMLKLGSLIGDHVKTGIGVRLTTGSVLGAGSNVYGSAMPPRYVAPFSWGEGDSLGEYRLEQFLDTTERAMGRRSMALDENMRACLAEAHSLRSRWSAET